MSKSFQQGWQYFSKASSAGISANAGQNYCMNVEAAIDTFSEEMYEIVRQHGNLGVGQCKGFVAEAKEILCWRSIISWWRYKGREYCFFIKCYYH